ncbi:MAG: tRNA pseudouridine synthase A, partial [Coriobacteriales bacterium]|nr:tRNA pseudouridine synthase A [Coriobacteriales bacterium]
MSTDQRTLALTVAYVGTDFHGFARQDSDVLTVQGVLEEALSILFAQAVETVGAGRTDAGVHALGQVVSFSLPEGALDGRELSGIKRSLNALTPDSIVICDVQEKPMGFSARFSALEREYRYRIVDLSTPPLFIAPYAWWLAGKGYLDLNLLRAGAQHLVGEHDFRSFCVAASALDKNTVREVKSINVFGVDHLGEHCV